MKHFVQYHNTEIMGYSASEIKELCIYTSKSVKKLSGNAVWLISGEGKSPKTFHLVLVFKANRTSSDTYRHPPYKNAAYGDTGEIFGKSIELTDFPWFDPFKKDHQNFKYGLFEVTDKAIINELRKLAGPHDLET